VRVARTAKDRPKGGLRGRRPDILFTDRSFHTIVAPEAPKARVDAGQPDQAELARGELRARFGATHARRYRKHIEKDARSSAYYSRNHGREPSVRGQDRHLRGLKERYEVHPRGPTSRDSAIIARQPVGARLDDRFLPDKATT